jgi:hypothetical protein
MDWSGRCRRLRVGRALNDNKCVTVPFPLMHATHLTFHLVGFALSLVPCLFFSVLVYCCRPTSCVFPSWLARASTSSPFLPLSFSPFSLPFPPVSISPLSHAHSHFSRTSQPKKNTINQIPHYSFVASISHTFSHETSSSFFFVNIIFTFHVDTFFFPVIIICSLYPFFFFSFGRYLKIFMLSFYIVAYQSFSL